MQDPQDPEVPPIHRQFRLPLPLSKHVRALFAEAKSTAYEDLGMRAIPKSLSRS